MTFWLPPGVTYLAVSAYMLSKCIHLHSKKCDRASPVRPLHHVACCHTAYYFKCCMCLGTMSMARSVFPNQLPVAACHTLQRLEEQIM